MVTSSFELEVERGTADGVETWLGVENVELEGPHGVYDDEATRGNRFRVDVHVLGPFGGAVASDDLRDTLDYERIVERIHDVSQRRRYHLIESFAGAIADDLLVQFSSLNQVRVCVRKLGFSEWGPDGCAMARVTARRR